MNRLPDAQKLPTALVLEKPSNNLAALTVNDSLLVLSNTLIAQWKNASAFKELQRYGIRPLDRALFFGPPGNGKTMSAQLIASKLDCPLYRVCCETLLTSEFGGTQKNLSNVMNWLARQPLAVVLWDECESLFPSRSASGSDACTREIVNTMQIFWQRLDRWETPQLFLLATNLIDHLDPALVSRIDLKLEFGPPTKEQALNVLEYWSEVLHEYGAEVWSKQIREKIEVNELPESFRELWQSITTEVRSHVTSKISE